MIAQCMVLNKILKTKDMSLIVLNNLTRDYFPNYPSEFEFIRAHYDSYRVVPDQLTFLNTFPQFEIVDVNEPDSFLINKLFEEYNRNYLATRFNWIKKLLEEDKTDQAIDYFNKSVEGLRTGGALTCIDVLKDTSRYDRFLDKANNASKYYISTGFPELDKLIGGIDLKNENMVIAARTGVGKSYTALKMATAASMQGLTVGFYSGEMHEDKVASRIDTLIGHIENSSINRGNLFIQKDYGLFLDNLKKQNYGPIKVLTPPMISGPATVDTLKAFIEKEKLDILFIDQYSLLEDTSYAKTSHERVANISKAVKNMQVMYQIPIISVAQMNRTKNEDGSQDTTQIGLSDRIPQDATVLLMLDKQEKDGKCLFKINVVKSRDGGDNRQLTYDVNWNKGEFTYIPVEGDQVASKEDYENLAARYNETASNDEEIISGPLDDVLKKLDTLDFPEDDDTPF